MKFKQIAVLVAAAGLAAAAIAGEEIRHQMAITVVDEDGPGETRIELDSDDLGFNLHDMQEGENRSIVDESGRTILVTREADGFKFDVDGKTIKMPAFDGHHKGAIWMSDGDITDVDVHVMHNAGMAPAHSMDGVMIISEKPVDNATRQAIKSMLESAGHGSEVRFVDSESGMGGAHKVRVIERKVEVVK
jgi:hypothetical protein